MGLCEDFHRLNSDETILRKLAEQLQGSDTVSTVTPPVDLSTQASAYEQLAMMDADRIIAMFSLAHHMDTTQLRQSIKNNIMQGYHQGAMDAIDRLQARL